ncbi:MAG: nickel pincer cofactor biosynthesis protein LarB, partial [Deltaproteobacteria bacterium]|nr:nickel pincer cofactor biosynthesis protein LarB [Deltaproteobacteria bacterium]
MDEDRLRYLLKELTQGRVSIEEALDRLKALPFEDIEVACIDHHRSLRRGAPEVIFGEGKEVSDILAIMDGIDKQQENILITRLSMEKAVEINRRYPDAVYHEKARVLTYTPNDIAERGRGSVLVICAGTSDIPVAEEAVLTARFMGNRVHKIYDVGVAGLHRLLRHREILLQASVIIVVAGMEGALPSVVGGLVDKPVIAVPTSVG